MSFVLQNVKKILNRLVLSLLSLFYHKKDINSVKQYEIDLENILYFN